MKSSSLPSSQFKTIIQAIIGHAAIASVASAADIYVSMAGKDSHPGTRLLPVASISKAKSLASQIVGTESMIVHVADGTYYLPETIVFTHADSGSAGYPVVYASDNEGGAILSGGSRLNLDWEPYRNSIMMVRTEPGLNIDQLFVGGNMEHK